MSYSHIEIQLFLKEGWIIKMKRLKDQSKLLSYINKFNINNFFEIDMVKDMELHSFNSGELIVRSYEEINYFYFLVEGKAKVYIPLKNGKSLLLLFYRPLQVIGDMEFLSYASTHGNVEALSNVICIGIPLDHLRKVASEDVKFLQFISRSLGKKLSNSSYWNAVNLLYPLENRLASYILVLADHDEGYTLSFNEIEIHKLTDMAELLGTSYRHLNRTLNTLCQKGLIKKKRYSIEIINRKGLEKLAEDLYD